MAKIVRVPVVLGHVAHRVVLRDVLRVLLHEILDRVPQRRDRRPVLVHRDRERCRPPSQTTRRNL